jgi:hypothetical protein
MVAAFEQEQRLLRVKGGYVPDLCRHPGERRDPGQFKKTELRHSPEWRVKVPIRAGVV